MASLNDLHRRAQKALQREPTPYEIKMKKILEDLQLNFKHEKLFIIGNNYYTIDFFLIDYKLAIEVDGRIHDQQGKIQRDIQRERVLLKSKKVIKIIRFKNEEVDNIDYVRNKIRQAIISIIGNPYNLDPSLRIAEAKWVHLAEILNSKKH